MPGTGATGSGELPNLGFEHSLQSSAGVDVLLDMSCLYSPLFLSVASWLLEYKPLGPIDHTWKRLKL